MRTGVNNAIDENGVWLLFVADADGEMVSELGEEDRVKGAFHIVVWWFTSSGLNIFIDFVFEGRHSNSYTFQFAYVVRTD